MWHCTGIKSKSQESVPTLNQIRLFPISVSSLKKSQDYDKKMVNKWTVVNYLSTISKHFIKRLTVLSYQTECPNTKKEELSHFNQPTPPPRRWSTQRSTIRSYKNEGKRVAHKRNPDVKKNKKKQKKKYYYLLICLNWIAIGNAE